MGTTCRLDQRLWPLACLSPLGAPVLHTVYRDCPCFCVYIYANLHYSENHFEKKRRVQSSLYTAGNGITLGESHETNLHHQIGW